MESKRALFFEKKAHKTHNPLKISTFLAFKSFSFLKKKKSIAFDNRNGSEYALTITLKALTVILLTASSHHLQYIRVSFAELSMFLHF